jgi:hypothetical protein
MLRHETKLFGRKSNRATLLLSLRRERAERRWWENQAARILLKQFRLTPGQGQPVINIVATGPKDLCSLCRVVTMKETQQQNRTRFRSLLTNAGLFANRT